MRAFFQKSLPLVPAQITLGSEHTFIMDTAGRLWAAGRSESGQLGDNQDTINRSVYQTFQPPTARVVQIVSDYNNSGLIDGNGMIWMWGDNNFGQIGNNTRTSPKGTSSPVSIRRSSSYTKLAIGDGPSSACCAAIDGSNGMIWTWGNNSSGQLGNNTSISRSSPVSIRRASSYTKLNINQAAMGAIDASNGMVWMWGGNLTGILGDGTSINRSSPVSILRSSSYADVRCVGLSTLFLDGTDGSVWSTGYNNVGQLGNNTTTSYSSPVSVLIGLSCVQIAGAGSTCYALDYQGTLWTWGRAAINIDSYVAEKDGISSPVSMLTNVSRVYTGGTGGVTANCGTALMDDGSLWYWGWVIWGQFGTNNAKVKNTPIIASAVSSNFINMAASRVLIFRDESGMVWTLGMDAGQGILGQGISGTDLIYSTPVSIVRAGSYTEVAISLICAGAIDGSNGMIWMWGQNSLGILGDNTTINKSSPVPIVRSASYKMLRTFSSSIAIDCSDGSVWTWGTNSIGQLGDNTSIHRSSPVPIARPGSYVYVAKGQNTGAAIDGTDGTVWCWGNNFGLLGDNTSPNRSSPVMIARSASYVRVELGSNASAAIDGSNGMIWTWGVNPSGMLGTNNLISYSSPVAIARSASYVKVAVGIGNLNMMLAIDGSDGSVWAWGQNDYGTLGDGTYENKSSPVSVRISKSCVDIKVGYIASYAVDYEGIIWSWGYNSTSCDLANLDSDITSVPVSFGKMITRP